MPVKTPTHLLPQLEPLEKKYDADVFIHNGDIQYELPEIIQAEITKTKSMASSRKNGLLILTTLGGYADPAYQVANLFQSKYERFFIYNPYYCKSAGTLMCLGANKLLMDELAEIGPLDVQIPSRKYVDTYRSGAQNMYTFGNLSTEVCNLYLKIVERISESENIDINEASARQIAIDLTIGIMEPIYAQIDPHELGSDLREFSIALHYGQRLAALSENLREETVNQLIEGYPSHDFVINFSETCRLFKSVEESTDDFREFVQSVTEYLNVDTVDKEDENGDTNNVSQTFSLTFGLRNVMFPKAR